MTYMDAVDYTDIGLQTKFRLMCRMTDPAMTIPEQVHHRLTRDDDIVDLVVARSDALTQLILYNMLQAYGFSGPFDKKEIELSDGDVTEAATKLRPLCSQLKKLTNGRVEAISNRFRSASAILASHWRLTASREKHSPTYSIRQIGCAWPEPSWEARQRYSYFVQCLKEPE